MIVYYKNKDGIKVKAEIKDQTCDCCGDDIQFMESDHMRASIACLSCMCDASQKWVEFNDDGTVKDDATW